MSQSVCRWGFLGTAAIARKNWKAIRRSGNGRVAAVASRSRQRAQSFIDECADEVPQIAPAEAVEGYQALLDREDVDAVYIPLPTAIRKEWVLKAAAAGKHVLCEKPVAVHADDAREMVDACAAAGVQFMDGVMFDHSARLAGVRNSLEDSSRFGRLRRINTHFSFCGGEDFEQSNIRVQTQLEPHGCLGDLGWYCIRFTLWALRDQLPTHVAGRTLTPLKGEDSEGEVPGEFAADLYFSDGISASFYCSFLTSNQQTAVLSGDSGYVTLDDFVLPFYGNESAWTHHTHPLDVINCRWNFGRHSQRCTVAEYAAGEANSQEVQMVRRLGQAARTGELDPRFADIALKTQQVLDACRRSDAGGGAPVPVEP